MQSWGEIARVGEPAAKPSHCPLCLKVLPLAEFKGVAPLRSLASCVIIIIAIFEPNYGAKHFRRSKLLCHIDVDSCYRCGVRVFPAHPESTPHLAPFFGGWYVKLRSGGRRTCRTYSYGPAVKFGELVNPKSCLLVLSLVAMPSGTLTFCETD